MRGASNHKCGPGYVIGGITAWNHHQARFLRAVEALNDSNLESE